MRLLDDDMDNLAYTSEDVLDLAGREAALQLVNSSSIWDDPEEEAAEDEDYDI